MKRNCALATQGRGIRSASHSYLYPITDLGVTVSASRTYLEQLSVSDRSSGADRSPISRTPSDSPAGSGPKHSIQWGQGPEFSGASVPVSERTIVGGLAVGGWSSGWDGPHDP